jgi:hypothetical protein
MIFIIVERQQGITFIQVYCKYVFFLNFTFTKLQFVMLNTPNTLSKEFVGLVLIHCHLNVSIGLFFAKFYIHQTAICDASVTINVTCVPALSRRLTPLVVILFPSLFVQLYSHVILSFSLSLCTVYFI